MLFAEEIGITQTWLSLLISKVRTPSPLLARRIQKATKGKVKAKELRPDLFN
jgi:DNA-binding transcriptional regulator YdaS (Cro superfamily)